ncbi:MAG: exosortase C-terminal domain/associated protein EpsI [Candidatus Zixiibacteriota bacterium]
MKLPVIIASMTILVAGTLGNVLRFTTPMPDRLPDFSRIPMSFGRFQGVERRFSDQSYDLLRADTSTFRMYGATDGEKISMFVAYFASQKYGSQIHSPKHCLPGGGWRIDRLEEFELTLADGSSRIIDRLIITDQDRQQLMFYWYETRSGCLSNEFQLKWDLVKNSLLLRPTDASFVRLTFPVAGGNMEAATERAVAFMQTAYPSIVQALPFQN